MLSHAAEEVAGIEAIEETVEVEDEVAEEVKAQDKVPMVPDTRVPSTQTSLQETGWGAVTTSNLGKELTFVLSLLHAHGRISTLPAHLNEI